MKFIFRKKYADILWNISKFQQELKIVGGLEIVPIRYIYSELTSPEYRMKDDKNNKINPALSAKIFESIIYGTPYPNALLETVVRRVRVDSGSEKLNGVRAGMIKAYINRNYKKEELKMALDKENMGRHICLEDFLLFFKSCSRRHIRMALIEQLRILIFISIYESSNGFLNCFV